MLAVVAACSAGRRDYVPLQDDVAVAPVPWFTQMQEAEFLGLDDALEELGARLSEVEDFFPLELSGDADVASQHFSHPYGLGQPDANLIGHRELLQLFDRDHPMVDKWMTYFTTKGRDQFERFYHRLREHGEQLQAWLRAEGLPPELIWLAFIESGINPKAYSRAHAAGMWQFIAATGRTYGLKYDFWLDERRDPARATQAAARHLADLYRQFKSWELAFSAYNAGPRRVDRAIRYAGTTDYWMMVGNRYALPSETRHYVPKMIAAQRLGQNPALYGLSVTYEIEPLENTVSIAVPGGLPLAKMAERIGVPERELHSRNLHLRRPITPPGKSTFVNIPESAAPAFADWIAAGNLPIEQWRADVYVVQKGDTLSGIAREFGTSVAEIKALNQLRNSQIFPKQSLVVPGPKVQAGTSSKPTPPPISSEQGEKYLMYRVRPGDTLTVLAQRFQTTIAAIQKANSRPNSNLKAGEVIKIPKTPSS